MPFDLFIFDFDGTLVDSTDAKRSAFYQLFPASADEVVTAVLGADPEGPRGRVIAEMLRRLRGDGAGFEADLPALVRRYTALTDEAVGSVPEFPGASALLQTLRAARKHVYVSSNTPEEPLKVLLQRRGWLELLDGASGSPARKSATARRLIDAHGAAPARTAVIGDGPSDRDSAEAVGACYFPVQQAGDLQQLARSWGLHV
jgi:phosphoglycolate phosphatase